MHNQYIETDPMILLEREKLYNLHKLKLCAAAKQIDNDSPSTLRLKKYISKTPNPTTALQAENQKIHNKLIQIYNRPAVLPRYISSYKTSPSVNRNREAIKIAIDNKSLAQRLISKKSTLSLKVLKTAYKSKLEYKEMISRVGRLRSRGLFTKAGQ